MRTMRFLNLYLLSMRERRALSVTFSPNVTMLRGSNGRGKSAIIKSLYDTFGATPHKIDSTWRSAGVTSMVEFSVEEECYCILKTGGRFSVYDSNRNRLIETSSITAELGPFLADLMDFGLLMPDRDGSMITPPPAYIFAPYYVDQDRGWVRPWDSFDRMYLKDSKRALSNYHTGIRSNAYYHALAKYQEQARKILELEDQRKSLRRALEEIRSLVEDVILNFNINDFERETEILIARSVELNRKEGSYRENLSNLSNERSIWNEQQDLVRAAMNEMRGSVALASLQPPSVECPTCGQHYDNSIASRFGMIADFDDLFEAYQEGEAKTREIEKKISDLRKTLGSIEAQIEQIDEILDSSRGDTTLGEVIAVQGRNETTALLREKVSALDALIGEALGLQKEADDEMKRNLNPERAKAINSFFDKKQSDFAHALDVRLEVIKPNIASPQLARGSEGPRGLMTYYYSVLHTAKQFGNATFCPIVIDAPNQQGQDAGHLSTILRFLVNNRPEEAQVIVATEETFDLSGDDISIIDVGVSDKQVLDDAEFENVSEHLRPYLGQLL